MQTQSRTEENNITVLWGITADPDYEKISCRGMTHQSEVCEETSAYTESHQIRARQ